MKTKKIVAVLSIICLMGITASGCTRDLERSETSAPKTADTSSIDLTEASSSSYESKDVSLVDSSTATSHPVETDAQIAREKLIRTPIQDDGKGDIYLGMSRSDFLAICEQTGVKLERRDDNFYVLGAYEIHFESDTRELSYMEVNGGHPGWPENCETSRGLRIGDSAEKMIALYGTDYVFQAEDSGYYRYYFDGYILEIVASLNSGVEYWSYFIVPDSPECKEEDAREASEMAGRTAN